MWKIVATIVTFCEGSRTGGIFFTFSSVEVAKNGSFLGGWRGGERGKKRTLWNKPQGPVIGYFILFFAKIIFCQRDDRGLQSQLLFMQITFLPIYKKYFILHLSSFSHNPSQKSIEKTAALPLSPSSLRLLSSHNPSIFTPSRRKGKIKKEKRRGPCCLPAAFLLPSVSSSLLFLSPFSLKKKPRKHRIHWL